MVGQILPCPKEVASTGYVLVCADSTGSPTQQSQYRWDYKAIEFDPINRVRIGEAFNVSKKEMEEWTNAN